MSAKVQAGGIIRKASDSTWRSPKLLRERVRDVYFRGVPFLDPCAPPDNPLGASRFFCGPTPGGVPTRGPLFGEPTQEEANRLDGLHEPWDLPFYSNIPFSDFEAWGPKLLAEVERWKLPGLLLLPVNRTEEVEIMDLLAGTWRTLFVRWPNPKSRHRIPFESSLDGVECLNNPFGSWILAYNGEPAPGRWWEAFGDLGRSFRVEEVKAPGPVTCSDLSASWCPRCGSCTCPRDEFGHLHQHDGPDCPLHAPASQHAEVGRGR